MSIINLFNDSGIKRPVHDMQRIKTMFENANLVISAWDGDNLVGIVRALTDFSYCCYISDLAVASSYQKLKIGQKLQAMVQKEAGEVCTILLLSAPEAMTYYPHQGYQKADHCFYKKRIV